MEIVEALTGFLVGSVVVLTWAYRRFAVIEQRMQTTNALAANRHIETQKALHGLCDQIVHAPDGKQVYLPLAVVLRALRQVESKEREKGGKGTAAPVLAAPLSIVDIVREEYGDPPLSVSGAPDNVQIADELADEFSL